MIKQSVESRVRRYITQELFAFGRSSFELGRLVGFRDHGLDYSKSGYTRKERVLTLAELELPCFQGAFALFDELPKALRLPEHFIFTDIATKVSAEEEVFE